MAIFSHVDLMGPAHRQNQVQVLAQKAAQNVLRRQRLRKLIQGAAAQAGGGGAGMPVHGSMVHHAPGTRGHIQRAAIPADQLQSMLQGAGGPAGVVMPGMTNPSGGGYDFGSIQDPTDPHQSPASLPPDTVDNQSSATPPPMFPGAPGSPGTTGGIGGPPSTPGGGSGGGYVGITPFTPMPPGAIPLGGGLFYDPATDTVIGGNAHTPGLQT